jgi:hypothetical protein
MAFTYAGSSGRSELTPKYLENKERLRRRFPEGARLLDSVENSKGNLWLSTATNLHLYKGDDFLAYVVFDGLTTDSPSLLWSPQFNKAIRAGTSAKSERLFPLLRGTMERLGGLKPGGWALRVGKDLRLRSTTPAPTIDEVIALLENLP